MKIVHSDDKIGHSDSTKEHWERALDTGMTIGLCGDSTVQRNVTIGH